MSCVPAGNFHNMCFGGNPAAVAPYLEQESVADTSCIDYSWCSGDSELCKSVSSARHFDAQTLATKLNDNIPKPCGCYYNDVKKYMYKLDPGSDVMYIDESTPIDTFRNTIKTHILDYGPIIGGYVVLKNFFTGNFTDPNFNGGVYQDRADYNGYSGGALKFSDDMTKEVAGLHAISIVGWGVAKNIQYDNDKYGDVPYWHCRNSWGTNWGNEDGYFKIAMFPFNEVAQFDKQVMTDLGGPVGSMILIRCTQFPTVTSLNQIEQKYRDNIIKQKANDYYKADPQQIQSLNGSQQPMVDPQENENDNGTSESKSLTTTFVIIIAAILIILIFWWMNKRA